METQTATLLSVENYRSLLSWINGQTGEKPSFAEEFIRQLDENITRLTGRTARRRNPALSLSLSSIMQEAQKEEQRRHEQDASRNETTTVTAQENSSDSPAGEKTAQQPILAPGTLPLDNEDGFLESGLDSLNVAAAIAWCYSRLDSFLTRGKPISMSNLQITLYIIYGFYLAQRRTRLVSEHPQMWKYGPVFPRVYDKMMKKTEGSEAPFREIEKKDPSLAEFIQRTVRNSVDRSLKKTTEDQMKPGTAYGITLKTEGEKWSTVIPDQEIYKEFQKKLTQQNR